ncbi:hypothetical protein SynBIOSE41_01140 [Synechococcus sp. BIOS-E4-1]|nr:hypothetical protein SynBIOSE41_01140 [Synechococcus sp. BIOS-E4-1]
MRLSRLESRESATRGPNGSTSSILFHPLSAELLSVFDVFIGEHRSCVEVYCLHWKQWKLPIDDLPMFGFRV